MTHPAFRLPRAPPLPARIALPPPADDATIAPHDRAAAARAARDAADRKLSFSSEATALDRVRRSLDDTREAVPLGLLSALEVLPYLGRETLGAVWRETPALVWQLEPEALRFVIARLDRDALPTLRALARFDALPADGFEHLDAWWIAPALPPGPACWRWLTAHRETATLGIVYAALADAAPERACSHLRWLAQRDDGELGRRVARERWGADAEAAVVELLRPEHATPPPFARPLPKLFATLPIVKLANGEAATRDDMDALGKILAQGLAPDHPAVTTLREACDRESLASIAGALFDGWVDGGFATQNRWIADAYVLAGAGDAIRSLGRLARKLARARPSHERRTARFLTEVLGRSGRDDAVAELDVLVACARDEGARDAARDELVRIACERGTSVEGMSGGIDVEPVLLDYGSRTFRASLDPNLVVRVSDGERDLDDLPRPTKKDDGAKAKAAKEAFLELKATVRDAIAMELARFERAMTEQHAIPVRTLRKRHLAAAVSASIARRLVWRTVDGALPVRFRVAEDGTFATIDDEPLDVAADAIVTVAHPLEWSDLERERWATLFGDYRVVQPFEQIARATFARETRVAGWKAHPGALLALGSGKWRLLRDRVAQGLERASARGTLTVAFAPGFAPEAAHTEPAQDLLDLRVSFGEASDVELSEAYRALSRARLRD